MLCSEGHINITIMIIEFSVDSTQFNHRMAARVPEWLLIRGGFANVVGKSKIIKCSESCIELDIGPILMVFFFVLMRLMSSI